MTLCDAAYRTAIGAGCLLQTRTAAMFSNVASLDSN